MWCVRNLLQRLEGGLNAPAARTALGPDIYRYNWARAAIIGGRIPPPEFCLGGRKRKRPPTIASFSEKNYFFPFWLLYISILYIPILKFSNEAA